jgi:hypothetical protein
VQVACDVRVGFFEGLCERVVAVPWAAISPPPPEPPLARLKTAPCDEHWQRTPLLNALYHSMIEQFPIGHDVIYMAFRWSVAEDAYAALRDLHK